MAPRSLDLVVIVPGFLPFGRFGGFPSLVDRMASALRGALEAKLGRSMPVLACTTMPAAGLATRQKWLLGELGRAQAALDPQARLHLVGHGPGGVDSQLLLGEKDLGGEAWGEAAERVRRRIATVVTFAAPHRGTCLATSELARFLRHPLRERDAIPSLRPLLLHLARLLPGDPSGEGLALGASRSVPDAARLIFQLFRHRELLEELSPARMQVVRDEQRVTHPAVLRSFVVAAGCDRRRGPDAMFLDLHRLTASDPSEPDEAMEAILDRLSSGAAPVIASDAALVPVFDLSTNDGLVSSARQLVSGEGDELAGIVIGDHADVLGHHDRVDAWEGKVVAEGLLRSGSGFGDDQLFELHGRIANIVAREARR